MKAGDLDQRVTVERQSTMPGPLGQPVLAGATATFECRLATALLWDAALCGTAGAIVAEIQAGA